MTQGRDDIVVDSAVWLIRHIERLLDADRRDDARGYLEKLLVSSEHPYHRIFALKHLGVLALQDNDREQAKTYLASVAELETEHAHAKYLLGDAAAAMGSWWLALLNFMEAYSATKGTEEGTTYMQAAANAFAELKFGEVALAVLCLLYTSPSPRD